MMQRHDQAHDRPVAPADHRGAAEFQGVHHRHDVRGHQLVGVGSPIAGAAAMAAAVDQHHLVPRADQGGNLVAPIVAVGEPAMKQHHRRAGPIDGVVDLRAVMGDVALAPARRQRSRQRQGRPNRPRGWRRRRFALRGPGERHHGQEGQYGHRQQPSHWIILRRWCGRRDSNPHAVRRSDLNRVRLPVPPRPHSADAVADGETEARRVDPALSLQSYASTASRTVDSP